MAATGKTPILLYGSTTPTNVPVAGNLTNSSDGCEIAINVADKNLFFKDSTNVVNTVPIRQSSASSNGWLSSIDWSTFNGKASTSSPTFSGNVTLSTGNLVIGTSGKGIDFSATAGTGTSELLADYEEGTWTPTFGGSTTYYGNSGTYTKIGRMVYINGDININVAGTGSTTTISGLPYAPAQSSTISFNYTANLATAIVSLEGQATTSSTIIMYSRTAASANVAANNLSGNNGARFIFSGCYSV